MKLKKRNNRKMSNVKLRISKKSLNHHELKKLTDRMTNTKENMFKNRKCSMKYVKNMKLKNEKIKLKNHDSFFLKLLNENKEKKLTPEKTIEFTKNLKSSNIVLSKNILLKLLKNFEKKRSQSSSNSELFFNSKKNKIYHSKLKIKKKVDFGERLKEIRRKAIKALVNEKFDLKSSSELDDFSSKENVDKKLSLLFQKELLLENLLNVLDSNKIDVTNILYTAFENIQSENYIPKTGKSLIKDGYFILEDKIRHPPKKKILNSDVKKNLKIDLQSLSHDLSNLDDESDSSDSIFE